MMRVEVRPELLRWACERSGFDMAALGRRFPRLDAWEHGGTRPAAVSTFLQVADCYLVAHALAHGDTLITHEIASTSTKRIKIPDACIGLGVKCMTPYEMLRFERARFILGPRPA